MSLLHSQKKYVSIGMKEYYHSGTKCPMESEMRGSLPEKGSDQNFKTGQIKSAMNLDDVPGYSQWRLVVENSQYRELHV